MNFALQFDALPCACKRETATTLEGWRDWEAKRPIVREAARLDVCIPYTLADLKTMPIWQLERVWSALLPIRQSAEQKLPTREEVAK